MSYHSSSEEEAFEHPVTKRFCTERNIPDGSLNGSCLPGPSKPTIDCDYGRATFSDSDSDDDKITDFDRESLLKEIDADIKSIIAKEGKSDKSRASIKMVNTETKPVKDAGVSQFRGKDQALYTLEIFMRDNAHCRTKKDRAGKNDRRAPIIYDNEGVANAIIPPNHKLMLLCKRTATNHRQYIKRGNFVLFKFYVDGEALSEVTTILSFNL